MVLLVQMHHLIVEDLTKMHHNPLKTTLFMTSSVRLVTCPFSPQIKTFRLLKGLDPGFYYRHRESYGLGELPYIEPNRHVFNGQSQLDSSNSDMITRNLNHCSFNI